MKVIVACANGAGTSLMMMNKIKQAFKELDYKGKLDISHCSLSEGKSTGRNADVIFCAINFTKDFDALKSKGVEIIGMKNILSKDEAIEKIKEHNLLEK
ncbi:MULTISPECIES: PTS sugar transporter subunit IIB [Anaerococcus]|uniref:PTS system, Lactose/Cellobiose specific IIB subunit n=4 Tax=Anaerococcus TaxID=165779 RepID=C7HUY7_9FIRM|nr:MULTISPECIES: PTS sugar transporter subunit IIB [Anaerococcus]EEU12436.1 PTS system, Lactose/Cellobiose specific IIB subunit [Anaerococcus vaginalis ATCC 51170]MBS4889700.1 PTS sugar transporter subunit IIB [Anaerococcus vaginalis]MBS6921168.1 PTS sugar transporter subunit IIB [Anaerococcus vaginalis]MDD7765671.1 PTS sugar transporter subunit IIB [Anaerococcus vaginalis]MDU0945789.1 PTS sugar transporter subunit IIB [Anaerococcus vaginalis]